MGGGMRIAPQAELDDRLLDVVVIGDFGKLELLKEFPKVYKGTHINLPKVSIKKATNVVIESAEPMLVYADGELLGECPVTFRVLPRALSIVV
jgi:diacylglycerol kinase (ATP)